MHEVSHIPNILYLLHSLWANNKITVRHFIFPRIHIYYTQIRITDLFSVIPLICAKICAGKYCRTFYNISTRVPSVSLLQCIHNPHPHHHHIIIDETAAERTHSPKRTLCIAHREPKGIYCKIYKLISFKWHKLLVRTDDKYIFPHFWFWFRVFFSLHFSVFGSCLCNFWNVFLIFFPALIFCLFVYFLNSFRNMASNVLAIHARVTIFFFSSVHFLLFYSHHFRHHYIRHTSTSHGSCGRSTFAMAKTKSDDGCRKIRQVFIHFDGCAVCAYDV